MWFWTCSVEAYQWRKVWKQPTVFCSCWDKICTLKYFKLAAVLNEHFNIRNCYLFSILLMRKGENRIKPQNTSTINLGKANKRLQLLGEVPSVLLSRKIVQRYIHTSSLNYWCSVIVDRFFVLLTKHYHLFKIWRCCYLQSFDNLIINTYVSSLHVLSRWATYPTRLCWSKKGHILQHKKCFFCCSACQRKAF